MIEPDLAVSLVETADEIMRVSEKVADSMREQGDDEVAVRFWQAGMMGGLGSFLRSLGLEEAEVKGWIRIHTSHLGWSVGDYFPLEWHQED